MSPGFKESAAIGPLADGSFAYRWPLPSTCEQHDGNQAARLSTAVLACEVQGGRRGSELGSLKSDMHVEDEAASRPAFGRGCPARLAVTCCKVRLSKSASSVRCEATRRLRPRVGFPNVIFYFILFFLLSTATCGLASSVAAGGDLTRQSIFCLRSKPCFTLPAGAATSVWLNWKQMAR